MKSKILLFFAGAILASTFLAGCDSVNDQRFEVTFKNYDQTVLFYNTVAYGETAKYQGAAPTRPSEGSTSYYFSGWDRPLENIRKDTTFIAQYSTTPTEIEITWKNYDGKTIETSTVQFGDTPVYGGITPTKPSNDQTVKYVFDTWEPEVVSALEPATYTATFKTTYRVSWYDSDGLLLETSYVEKGEIPEYPGFTPTKVSYDHNIKYVFDGWTPELAPIEGPMNYHAKFLETRIDDGGKKDVNIVYSIYNPKTNEAVEKYQYLPRSLGDISQSRLDLAVGSDIDLYADPNEGYTFVGWYYKNLLLSSDPSYKFRVWDEDIELEARFKYTTYYLTLKNSNSSYGYVTKDSSGTTNTQNYYSMFYTEKTIIHATARDEIRFLGWYDDYNNLASNNAVFEYTMPNKDVTLTGKWNLFSVSYTMNGGTYNGEKVTSYDLPYDERYINLTTPSKTGYTFLGWRDNDIYDTVTRLDKDELRDFRVEALWEANTYYVYFYDNIPNSNKSKNQSAIYDQYFNLRTNTFTRTGYTFNGWNTKADGTGTYYSDEEYVRNLTSVPNGTFALYAVWQANTYTVRTYIMNPYASSQGWKVSFDTNGAKETIADQYVNEESTLKYPGIVTKDSYVFTGWYSNKACTQRYDFTSAVTENITLYAGWKEMTATNYYSREFIDATKYTGSSSYRSDSFYNTTSSYKAIRYVSMQTTGTAYIYFRCTTSSSYYYYYVSVYNETQGTTLFTNYNVSSTSFNYYNSMYVYAGDVIRIEMYNYYSGYTATANYYFTGIGIPSDGGTANIKTAYETKTVIYDRSYKLSAPVYDGVEFAGWFDGSGNQYTDENGDSLAVWSSTPDSIVYLYSKWNYTEYTIQYELNGGTNSPNNPDKYKVNDCFNFENPTREGYEFKGWYLDSSFETPISEIKNGAYYSNIKLYAKWEAEKYTVTLVNNEVTYLNSYTLTFNSMGGSSVSSQTVTNTNPLTYPAIPTRSGYVFRGWYEDQQYTKLFDFSQNLTENKTVYACWDAMVSSYYSRTALDASSYYSSSYAYSTSVYASSSSKAYYYVSALTGGFTMYYRNNSTSSGYRVYLAVYNVTKGTTIFSNSYISTTSYYSLGISATAGDVIRIEIYRYSSSYTPTFYMYFTNYSKPTAGGLSPATHIYKKQTVTYGEDTVLDNNVEYEGHTFVGWYDENDEQYTDGTGQLLENKKILSNLTLYAHWE